MLSDRKLLIGIGIGIIIGTIAMFGYKMELSLSKEAIEKKAKSYGMDYPEEFKVINKKDVGK